MKKYFTPALFAIVVVAVLGFAIKASLSTTNDAKPEDTNDTHQITEDDKKGLAESHTYGSVDAQVVLSEFGDFQCPACKAYEETVRGLRTTYADQLKLVFKHFPLYPSPHKNAQVAAYASEAAANQGKFWEMHDALYDKQDDWAELGDPQPIFDQIAQGLGLDVGKFTRDCKAEAGKDAIARDKDFGTKLKLAGTPSFFINGVVFDTKLGVEALKSEVKAAVEKQ